MSDLPFLGRGLRFPFSFDHRSGGTATSGVSTLDHAHVHESIRQILGTRQGERLMRPDFGTRLHELVFEPNDQVLKAMIRHHVVDALRRWEKRIIVTSVAFDDDPTKVDTNTLLVLIDYRLIQSQQPGNLVWPFYRESSQGA